MLEPSGSRPPRRGHLSLCDAPARRSAPSAHSRGPWAEGVTHTGQILPQPLGLSGHLGISLVSCFDPSPPHGSRQGRKPPALCADGLRGSGV